LLHQSWGFVVPVRKARDQDFPVFVIFLEGLTGPGGLVWVGSIIPHAGADDEPITSYTTTRKISIMGRRKSKKVRHWTPKVTREIKMLPATVIFSCSKCGRRYEINVAKEDIPRAKFHCPHDGAECDKIPISKESSL